MRLVVAWALAGVGVLWLGQAALTAAARAPQCSTSAGMADASKKTRPSSFAPRPKRAHNAYGAPVGHKILSRRAKKSPALHSSPLP